MNSDAARRPHLTAGLPPRRRGYPASDDLLQRRAATTLAEQPAATSVRVAKTEVAGVSCLVCRPPAPQGRMIYLHGGGYRQCSAAAYRPFGTRLAAASRLTVVLVDYPLAPEQPFPNALHEVLTVLGAVRADRMPLLLGGDSAGGGLALASALVAAAMGVSLAGSVLFSPWLDLTNSSSSFNSRAATDPLFSKESADEAAAAYLQGVSATNPLASPLFGDLEHAPPTLVLTSGAEVLLDDSLRLAAGLAAAGRPVQLHVTPGQWHVWPVLQPAEPASIKALHAVAAFARAILPDAA